MERSGGILHRQEHLHAQSTTESSLRGLRESARLDRGTLFFFLAISFSLMIIPLFRRLLPCFASNDLPFKDPVAYAEGCTAELNVELQKRPASTRTPTRYAPDKNTPIKIYNSAPGSDKRPVDHTPSLSTPRSTAVNSRSYTASSSSIQKRLDKLQYYAEPPELSPIVIRSSKRVSLDYRSPVRVSDVNSADTSTSVTKSGGSNSCLSPKKQ